MCIRDRLKLSVVCGAITFAVCNIEIQFDVVYDIVFKNRLQISFWKEEGLRRVLFRFAIFTEAFYTSRN